MGFKDAGKPHYLGHRERLRRRFRDAGPDALPDYELLELILFRAAPRRDTKSLAKALIARFGTFAEAVNVPEELLREVPGIGEAAITELKLVRAAALRLMRGEVLERPVLSSWSQVLDYCRASMGFESKEQFRILFLDKRNQIIADEVQQTGTVDHTPVYVREVVKRALELSATAIMLVHNYPSRHSSPRSITYRHSWSVIQHDFHRGSPVGYRAHRLQPGEKEDRHVALEFRGELVIREAVDGHLPNPQSLDLFPAVPVNAAEIEHCQIVVGIEREGLLIGLDGSRRLAKIAVGCAKLKPTQGVRLYLANSKFRRCGVMICAMAGWCL